MHVFSFFSPPYSWMMTKLSWADGLQELFYCQECFITVGIDRSRLLERKWVDDHLLEKEKDCTRGKTVFK